MHKALWGVAAIPLTLGLLVPTPASAIDHVNTKKLRNAVTVNGILQHERAFQRIANKNGGTRASGTPGYDASADVRGPAAAPAGYQVTSRSSPSRSSATSPRRRSRRSRRHRRTYETGTFDYSGERRRHRHGRPDRPTCHPADPAPSSTSGCEAATSRRRPPGPAIALIQRGTCTSRSRPPTPRRPATTRSSSSTRASPVVTELFIGTLGDPQTIPVVGPELRRRPALVRRHAGRRRHRPGDHLDRDRPEPHDRTT